MEGIKYEEDERTELVPSWTATVKLEDLWETEINFDDLESCCDSEYSSHLTDSNLSAYESESENEIPGLEYLLGKDSVTQWHIHPPHQNAQTLSDKTKAPCSQVNNCAKQAKDPLECWKLFFPDSLICYIVQCTNKNISEIRRNYSRFRDCQDTDVAEVSALFGLLYMAGINKAQHMSVKELWDKDGTAPECFKATMGRERFVLLLRALCFHDVNNCNERKLDNIAHIRYVFEEFIAKCRVNYQIGEWATVDEMLVAFKGKCKFRQNMPNKSAKLGIKLYALVDSKEYYTYNLEIYAGQQKGPCKLNNSANAVVKRIARPLLNTGRNITLDNYFTSVSLALELLQSKTTVVGALNKNHEEIPPRFVNTKNRPVHSSSFAFLKTGVLVSYKPDNYKNVLIFSTFHNDSKIDHSTGHLAVPEIVTFYNSTKTGVEVVDELKSVYSVSRTSSKWPLTLFFSLLDIGGINSHIIFKSNTDIILDRRIYLKTLALALIKAHLWNRSVNKSIPVVQRKAAKRIAGVGLDTELEPIADGFCAICPRRKNRRTKKRCNRCNKSICTEHTTFTCSLCMEEN